MRKNALPFRQSLNTVLGGMSDILQEARVNALGKHIGLISDGDLISWADQKISELNDPPSFLIDLAFGEMPRELNVTQNEPDTYECSELMKLVSTKFELAHINIDQLGSCSYKLALISSGRSSELLHWISDEIHLCDENVKILVDSLPGIKEAIDEIIQLPSN